MPLITGYSSGGSGGVPQLPEQIDNFQITANNLSTTLSWTKPVKDENNSYIGVRIVRKEGSCPTGVNDGVVVYEGSAITYTDSGLTDGVEYFYRAFSYNADKKYQTSMRYVNIAVVAGPPASFADASWEQIIEACNTNTVPATWTVGDSRTMVLGGVSYAIDIIGKNHDDYADGSGKAPLTLQMHDCYSELSRTSYLGTSSNIWTSSEMRTTTLLSILYKMPVAVLGAVKEVNKKTGYGNTVTGTDTNKEKVFLPAEIEITGSKGSSYSGEGSRYEYYSSSDRRIKYKNGTAQIWWTRSPVDGSANTTRGITTSGSASSYTSSETYGVAPAFCLGNPAGTDDGTCLLTIIPRAASGFTSSNNKYVKINNKTYDSNSDNSDLKFSTGTQVSIIDNSSISTVYVNGTYKTQGNNSLNYTISLTSNTIITVVVDGSRMRYDIITA